jgi:hypothetical protein
VVIRFEKGWNMAQTGTSLSSGLFSGAHFSGAIGASRRSSLWRAMILLLLLLMSVAVIAWMATRENLEREIAQVSTQSDLLTQARATAVAEWLTEQKNTVRSIADNPSVQLYADSVSIGDDVVSRGQAGYLNALLASNAARTGLLDVTADIKASIPRVASPGLAIVNGNGKLLASVGGPLPKVQGFFATLKDGFAIDTLSKLGANQPAVRIGAAVDASNSGIYVYLVRRLDTALADRLAQPGESARQGEAVLLAPGVGGKPLYLTARRGIAAGTLALADPLAEAALKAPTKTSLQTDSDGTRYLMTARSVTGSTWVVMRLSPADAVLEPIQSRHRLWLWSIVSALGLAGTLGMLAWRQGITERAAEAAETEHGLRQFLQTVTDLQPTAIAVVESSGQISFANKTAQNWASGTSAKSLTDILGQALPTPKLAGQILLSGTKHLLVDQIPLDAKAPDEAQLVTALDISELVQERARREASLQALVMTLAGLIDARDPGSIHHSERVSHLAVALGTELQLAPAELETLRISGILLNIGKIIVPRSILTKAGALSDDERHQVAQARVQTAVLLADVPFDGPVADTIANATSDEPKSQLAAILTFANAYIGMISPRAHRAPMSLDAALASLRDKDNAPLASALAHYLDNHGGREALVQPV